jgi:hypothetical protein
MILPVIALIVVMVVAASFESRHQIPSLPNAHFQGVVRNSGVVGAQQTWLHCLTECDPGVYFRIIKT